MIDVKYLNEFVDMSILCDELGIETRKKGNRVQCICPFHEDNNFGSAFVYNNAIHCFSCGENADAIKLVQHIKGLSFNEAVKYLAKLFGIKDYGREITAGESDYYANRLTKEEEETLNIPSTEISLKSLYFLNKELYKEVILRRAKELLSKTEYLLANNATDRDGEYAPFIYKLLDSKATRADYFAIKKELKKKKLILISIIDKLSSEDQLQRRQ